jgi:hypothetical protein
MTVGTFFTLFVIPSIYMLIAKNKTKHEVAEEMPATSVHAPQAPAPSD